MATKKILVVEDFKSQRLLIKTVLGRLMMPTEILEAEHGEDALEILKDQDVDLVISDLEMPDMDGLQLIKNIRSSSKHSTVPILMISSRDDKREEILKAGANRFIHKPFDSDDVFNIVEQQLTGSANSDGSKNVLLVDDVESQADIHETFLAMPLLSFDKAFSAKEAWSKLKKKRYDLLICDLRMPEVDGPTLIKKIASVPQLKHMRIVAITEDDSIKKADLPDAVEALFYKPVNPTDVKKKIKLMLN